jgi:hypothetical protein
LPRTRSDKAHPLTSTNSRSVMDPIIPGGAPAPAFLHRLDGRTVAGSSDQAPSAQVSAVATFSLGKPPHHFASHQATPGFVAGPPAPAPLSAETLDGRIVAGSDHPAPRAPSSSASIEMSSAGAQAPSKPLDRRPLRPSTPAVSRGDPGPAPILRPREDQSTDHTGRRKAGQG